MSSGSDLICHCGIPMQYFRENSRISTPMGPRITRVYYCDHCRHEQQLTIDPPRTASAAQHKARPIKAFAPFSTAS